MKEAAERLMPARSICFRLPVLSARMESGYWKIICPKLKVLSKAPTSKGERSRSRTISARTGTSMFENPSLNPWVMPMMLRSK